MVTIHNAGGLTPPFAYYTPNFSNFCSCDARHPLWNV